MVQSRPIVVAGPSGSGKTTIGMALAARLSVPFVDADALHPPANVAKMAAGEPLDEADRLPWLAAVGAVLAGDPDGIVVACSALRRRYRDLLRGSAPGTLFVGLAAPVAELERRMLTRTHFMPPTLLASQLLAWEPFAADEPGFEVVNVGEAEAVVDAIVAELRRREGDQSRL